MRVILAVAVVALALAGCADSLETSSPATALELRATAEAEAEEIDALADLVAVFGPEWTNESFGERFEEESPEAAALNQGADAKVGDGLSKVWGFLFTTSGQPLLVALDGNGNVLHADYIEEDSDTADDYGNYVPLGDVAIDSDKAANVVKDNSERFTDIIAQPDAVVIMALGEDEEQGTPFWIFTAFTESEEDDFSFSLVNAEDGSYMDFESFFG